MSDYWRRQAITRRSALRYAALAGGGAATLGLVGCGGGASKVSEPKTTETQVLDPAKGVRGGKLIWQSYGDPGAGLELVKVNNMGVHQIAGLTHDGLLEHRNGTPSFDGYDIFPQPNLAQAMPETSPDGLTLIVKLRPAKFHNGRTVTSEDVKYSYERFAFGADSAYKNTFTWLDKVETPDPQTAVIKTKLVFADAPMAMAARENGEILAKEHEESPEHEKKLMGTGPYIFVEYSPPSITRYRRNPEYHRQPYPYFEEVDRLGDADTEKKLADFAAHSVHYTYWFNPEFRERLKKLRPDAKVWTYLSGGGAVYMRTDQPPYNDKRVRQALQMSVDRKAFSQAITGGEGEPDQALSIAGKYWGFRKPSELGAAAKYWSYDPQTAKQLMTAAGASLPLTADLQHWNASVVGPQHVDAAVLIAANWRNAGIANVKNVELTFGQAASTLQIGNYQGLQFQPNTNAYNPIVGLTLKNMLWAPPEGIKGPPTLNRSYVSNPQLSALLDRQIGQRVKEERVQTFRAMEDIMAEEQYWLSFVTSSNNWFGDSIVLNMQAPRDAYNGTVAGIKYWWFKNGRPL